MFTPSNITAGFLISGIEPFNSEVFGDDEFLPSSVTDRPDPGGDAPNLSATNVAGDNNLSTVMPTSTAGVTSPLRPTLSYLSCWCYLAFEAYIVK